MLHPLMPFITEELWHAMAERACPLITAQWPSPDARVDLEAKAEMEWLKQLISDVRAARTAVNVPPGATLTAWISGMSNRTRKYLDNNVGHLARMARMRGFSNVSAPNRNTLLVPAGEATFSLEVSEVIDVAAERARLSKNAASAEKERDSLAARLANPNFAERAKPEAVEKARADHVAKAAEAERLRAALERLG
jgi:valyl-tRNA synthetase